MPGIKERFFREEPPALKEEEKKRKIQEKVLHKLGIAKFIDSLRLVRLPTALKINTDVFREGKMTMYRLTAVHDKLYGDGGWEARGVTVKKPKGKKPEIFYSDQKEGWVPSDAASSDVEVELARRYVAQSFLGEFKQNSFEQRIAVAMVRSQHVPYNSADNSLLVEKPQQNVGQMPPPVAVAS